MEVSMDHLSRRRALVSAAITSGLMAIDIRKARGAIVKRSDLPIPPELKPDAAGRITLQCRPGWMYFHAGSRTATYGVNGPFLGPAVRIRRGQSAHMHVVNLLPEEITMHWHGL